MRIIATSMAALGLFIAACGGGSGEDVATSSPAPAATTAKASAAATVSGAPTTSGAATSAATDEPGATTPAATQAITKATTAPLPADLPDGFHAITDYFRYPPAQDGSSRLITVNITDKPASGTKTFWYTYEDGAWKELEPAFVLGGNPPQAQTSFSPIPANLVILAED